MHIRGAVQADTYEKVFFAEKFSPLLGNGKTICLDSVLHGNVLLVVLSHRLRKETKEIQSGQRWLAALKGERNKAARLKFRKAALNQRFRRCL